MKGEGNKLEKNLYSNAKDMNTKIKSYGVIGGTTNNSHLFVAVSLGGRKHKRVNNVTWIVLSILIMFVSILLIKLCQWLCFVHPTVGLWYLCEVMFSGS